MEPQSRKRAALIFALELIGLALVAYAGYHVAVWLGLGLAGLGCLVLGWRLDR